MEPLYGRRVVVAGGTGLVGRALVPALASAGAGVVLLERRPTGLVWPAGVQAWPWERAAEALEGAFGLVNLAGAGIAAEVIGLPGGSLGERLYTAKVYFQTEDLFAWTAVIVAVSLIFERLFLRAVNALAERLGSL